jgi:hypothetical protein
LERILGFLADYAAPSRTWRHAARLAAANALFLFAVAACIPFDSVTTEAQRIASPRRDLDVVLTRTDGGATTEYTSWRVYVVKSGRRVHDEDEVAWFYGGDVEPWWTGRRDLEIEHGSSQDARLLRPKFALRTGDSVRVTLRPGPD